jgi:hypothetical protein
MTIALLGAICVAMLVLAFLMPRLWATTESAPAGRRPRGKVPL